MTRRWERPTRRLERVRTRVSEELAKNVMWRFVAAERFWICPYCGMVGANLESGQDPTEVVSFHLLRQCTHFDDFEGPYVSRDILRSRALEVLVGWKLTHDVGWRFFDDRGRWFCPYCARPQVVQGLRTEAALRELKLVATAHLHGCPTYADGRGTPRGHDDVSREVALETRAHRFAEQIAYAMAVDPAWTRTSGLGHPICPYCFRALAEVDASTPFSTRESVPAGMARHLVRYCEGYRAAEAGSEGPHHIVAPLPPQPPAEFFADVEAAVTLPLQEHRVGLHPDRGTIERRMTL